MKPHSDGNCIRILAVCLTACFIVSGCAPDPREADATYYLVRHAEKTDAEVNPGLTDAGKERAVALEDRLADIPLTAIYSTDYVRTLDTAGPSAGQHGLEVQIYDSGALPEFAGELRSRQGHILVVGHSNTTPTLSELLGGPAGEPIVEATEYDRLYIIARIGKIATGRIERYGR